MTYITLTLLPCNRYGEQEPVFLLASDVADGLQEILLKYGNVNLFSKFCCRGEYCHLVLVKLRCNSTKACSYMKHVRKIVSVVLLRSNVN
jgi:hypothetical protein